MSTAGSPPAWIVPKHARADAPCALAFAVGSSRTKGQTVCSHGQCWQTSAVSNDDVVAADLARQAAASVGVEASSRHEGALCKLRVRVVPWATASIEGVRHLSLGAHTSDDAGHACSLAVSDRGWAWAKWAHRIRRTEPRPRAAGPRLHKRVRSAPQEAATIHLALHVAISAVDDGARSDAPLIRWASS